MTDGSIVAAALLALLVVLPATLGLVFEAVRANRPKAEVLISADDARARTTLAYFTEVHDSHSG